MRLLLDRLRPDSEVESPPLESPAVGQFQILDVGVDHVGAEDDAKSLRLDAPTDQAGIRHREVGGGEAQLDVAAHHFQALPRPYIDLGVEIGNLTAVGGAETGRVEQVDGSDAARAGGERSPEGVAADADGRHDADACDDDIPGACHKVHTKPRRHPPEGCGPSRATGRPFQSR